MFLALFVIIAIAVGILTGPLFGAIVFVIGFIIFLAIIGSRRRGEHVAAGSPSARAAEQGRAEEKEARIR